MAAMECRHASGNGNQQHREFYGWGTRRPYRRAKMARQTRRLTTAPLEQRAPGWPPADRRQCFHPGSEIWYPHIMEYQDLLSGFVRMHILHHAAESDIYGQWMIDELAHHGYKMSAGTLYPMLHGMEQKGYLKSYEKRSGKTYR